MVRRDGRCLREYGRHLGEREAGVRVHRPRRPHPSGAIALTCGPNATVQYRSITLEEWADGPGAAASVAPAPAAPDRPAPAADPARRVWASDQMTFENFEPGRWRKVNDFHRRIFYYRESGRSGQSVELFNPFRGQGGIWVRLGDGRGEIKPGTRSGWSPLADGRWTSTPPAAARIATGEAVRRLEEDVRKLRDPERVAARGHAFKEDIDRLIADFEARVVALRASSSGDASGLMAWTKAVRDSAGLPRRSGRGGPDPGRSRRRAPPGRPRGNWERPPTTWNRSGTSGTPTASCPCSMARTSKAGRCRRARNTAGRSRTGPSCRPRRRSTRGSIRRARTSPTSTSGWTRCSPRASMVRSTSAWRGPTRTASAGLLRGRRGRHRVLGLAHGQPPALDARDAEGRRHGVRVGDPARRVVPAGDPRGRRHDHGRRRGQGGRAVQGPRSHAQGRLDRPLLPGRRDDAVPQH